MSAMKDKAALGADSTTFGLARPHTSGMGRFGGGGGDFPSKDSGSELSDGDFDEHFDEQSSGDDLAATGRVEDADWELARGDFTKMFNRSRQIEQVNQGRGLSNVGASSSSYSTAVPLPAMNRARKTRTTHEQTDRDVKTSNARAPRSTTQSGDVSERLPADKTEEQLSQLQARFASRMQINDAYDPSRIAGGAISGNVPRKGNVAGSERRIRDKSDRSTVQQVLDPRTLVILFKMLQRGLLKQVNGVISTGKEANVYHASTFKYAVPSELIADGLVENEEEGLPLALKIFKTTILVFKDRDRYITGEFRFRHGYARHNPRKMVKLWAEKEARNLKRLVGAGMRCPRPIELRDHVLVMEFLEDGTGRNSPRLRDAESLIDARCEDGEENLWEDLYVEMVAAMRTMFHQCHLVHADLSEYNALYHRNHLYIIDVSQSVEHDHPYAFEFLRADIQHVDDYFAKKGGVRTMGIRRTFEWIVRPPARSDGEKSPAYSGQKVPASRHSVSEMRDKDCQENLGAESQRTPNTLDTLASGPFATFEMITRGPGESDEELQSELKSILASIEAAKPARGAADGDANAAASSLNDAKQDEAVFRRAYIPQTLNEVFDPERDISARNEGKGSDLIYANVIGIDNSQKDEKGQSLDAKVSTTRPNRDDSAGEQDDSSEAGSDSSQDESDEQGAQDDKKPRGHKHEDRDAKKERKKQVKEAARERRKTKMPKAEKKRRMRNTHK